MNYDDLLRELKMESTSFPDISAEDLANIMRALENHFCNATNPVRYGRWIDVNEYHIGTCSACGNRWGSIDEMHYCPNCGAKMDESNYDKEVKCDDR